jgi:hypothetical protein
MHTFTVSSSVGQLSGPWWHNDSSFESEREYPPQEAFFRLEFSGRAASFAIATGCFYQVWLNGVWLGFGPARASHGRLTIDRWNLPAEQLRAENVVAVQAFWEGIFTFDHVRGEPGIWIVLDGAAPDAAKLHVSPQTGRTATHRFSHQRGWVEEINNRERAAGWPAGPWKSEQWQPAVRRTNAPVVLEERDILPFVSHLRRAESVTFAGAASLAERTPHRALGYENQPGFAVPDNSPSRNIHEEALRPTSARDENLAGLTMSGSGDTILAPDPGGLDRTVQLDFGKYISGMLTLEITAPAGTQIDAGWSELPWNPELASRWSESGQPGGSVTPRECNDSRQGLRYVCGGERERIDSLFVMAMGHLRLTFRTPSGTKESIVLHDLAVRVAGYPIEREGDFRCSDDSLNRMYRAAIETMENSIFDVYMDTPGRERGGWLNDSYSTAAGMAVLSSDTAFERRFLRQFIDSLAVNAGAQTVLPLYPSECHKWNDGTQRPITCHTLFWLLQAERHLRLFGDEELRSAWRPGLRAVLEGLGKYRNAEGLLESVPWDDFIDWSPVETGPLRAFTNFVYGFALTKLGALLNDTEWTRDGAQALTVMERASWHDGRQLYADTLRREGSELTRGDRFSELTNYVALWSGAVPRAREEIVWRQLRNIHPRTTDRPIMNELMDLVRCNAYGLIYRFEILGRRGEIGDLARDLREEFLPMIERGQTTLSEHICNHYSLCHGFQSYAAHVIARYIGGIQLPEQPGGIIRLRPNPVLLAWSQTRVPWMGGHVQLWCARRTETEADVLISLPAGQRGELVIGAQPPIEFESTLQTRVRFRL